MTSDERHVECRGCGKQLVVYDSGFARDPLTKNRAERGFYGGYNCSFECEVRLSLRIERTMPGHDGSQMEPQYQTMKAIRRIWNKE